MSLAFGCGFVFGGFGWLLALLPWFWRLVDVCCGCWRWVGFIIVEFVNSVGKFL